MRYNLECLLCGHTGKALVPMQEHAMSAHAYTREDLQKQKSRSGSAEDELPVYIYAMPDGKDWLKATAAGGGNNVNGL